MPGIRQNRIHHFHFALTKLDTWVQTFPPAGAALHEVCPICLFHQRKPGSSSGWCWCWFSVALIADVCIFWCSLVNANQATGCWAVSTGPTRGRQALMPTSWSLFLKVWSETCTPAASWRSGWCPSTALSSSPCITAGLLVSPPCS